METLTASVEEISGVDIEEIRDNITVDVDRSRILVPALAMSGACLAVLAIGGAIERGSPWAGINSVTAGLGLSSRRPPMGFHKVRSLVGIGTVLAGTLLVAGIQSRLAPRVGGGRIGRALVTSAVSVGLDALLMRSKIFSAFANALGVGGTVAKYAAIGAASAIV